MSKIVQIRINDSAMIDLGTGERAQRIAHLCDWHRADGLHREVALWSPHMVLWSPQVDEMVYHLNLAFPGGQSVDTWCVVDYSDEYTLVETTAELAYDYGYCVQVCDLPESTFKKSARIVAIPHSNVEYQTARYASGLHGARLLQIETPISKFKVC